MSAFELRSYRSGDEARVVEMFERVFREPYDLALWRWKYLEGPSARPELSVVAEGEGGALVGHGAVFCSPLNLIGRKKGCGQVTDLMIDPALQKTGIGSAIYVRCVEQVAAAGFPVCLAFPNERSAVGLHWHAAHVAIMEKYEVTAGGAEHAALAAEVDAEPEVPRFELDERVDDLFASAARLESLSVWKDRAYLEWRYARHPRNAYRFMALAYGDLLMGLAVVKPQGRRWRLMELIVRDKRATVARRLLLEVVGALEAPAAALEFVGRDPWFFADALGALARRPYFSHHVFARAVDREQAFLYENPLNWTFTLGDCDSQ